MCHKLPFYRIDKELFFFTFSCVLYFAEEEAVVREEKEQIQTLKDDLREKTAAVNRLEVGDFIPVYLEVS